MQTPFDTIETLKAHKAQLVEVELMLTPDELKKFADYCLKNEIKFNDWIRRLAHDDLEEKSV
jgi:hypothetical protein